MIYDERGIFISGDKSRTQNSGVRSFTMKFDLWLCEGDTKNS